MSNRPVLARARCVLGVELAIVTFPPGRHAGRPQPTHLEICHVREGEITTGDSRSPHAWGPGDTLVRCGRRQTSLNAGPHGATALLLHVDRRWRGWRWLRVPEPTDLAESFEAGTSISRSAGALHDELERGESASDLTLLGLALATLGPATQFQATPAAPAWLSQVRRDLELGGQAPCLLALARRAGVHRAHLTRAFRKHFGVSISVYRRELAVRTACRLLAEPSARIHQVALATGFADQSHFARTFRKVIGVSPTQYRDRSRGGSAVVGNDGALLDPVGSYAFRSTTADGAPYHGTFEIRGRPGAYKGRASTSVLPDLELAGVATHGQSMILTVDAPGGTATIRLTFTGREFVGRWSLGANGATILGRRLR